MTEAQVEGNPFTDGFLTDPVSRIQQVLYFFIQIFSHADIALENIGIEECIMMGIGVK